MIDHHSLIGLLDQAATTDPAGSGDETLLTAALALEAARCRLDAAQAHVLAELERRGTTGREFGMHTGPWLARDAHLPVAASRERVRVAVKLSTLLPGTDAALTAGRISWDHAAVVARAANPRIADAVAAIEDELIDAAADTVFESWRREVAGRAEELDQDGGHDPNRDLARNRLGVARTFDGATHLSGMLTGEFGAVAAWAINAHADRLFHTFKRDHKAHPEIAIPPRATLRALALAEICRLAGIPVSAQASGDPNDASSPAGPQSGPGDIGDDDPPWVGGDDVGWREDNSSDDPAWGADLAGSPDRAPTRDPAPPDPVARPGPAATPDPDLDIDADVGGEADVVPTGDRWRFSADGVLPRPEVLLILHADHAGDVYTDDGIRLPGGLDHPLLADPNFYAVVVDSLGEPLDLGRQVRLATAAQRRAIRIRDGGCIFPGCDAPLAHCDVHHVIPWDAQGPTNLRLLAAGCRHHHRIWHRPGWVMRATDDGWFWWQTPAGRTFWSQRHGRQQPGPAPMPILIVPPHHTEAA